MRYGLCLTSFGTYSDPRNVIVLAEQAEAAGWEALLYWDHLAFVWGPPAGDPWVTLAAVASRTDRLLLGTNVTPVPRRRPHVLAHQVSTLDLASGGRAVIAVGIGGVESEFAAFGEPTEPRVRAEMLDEALPLLRSLWSGEQVTHRGRHYLVDGVELRPRPVQERIPIWVGGNSSRALRRAARYDGWAADSSRPDALTMTPEELVQAVETIRGLRGGLEGFDVVVNGIAEPGDRETPAAYAEAGATWWLEGVHDLRGSFDELLALVRGGPPT